MDKEKPYGIMGLGPRWNHRDLAMLVMYRNDLGKAAKILGRTEDACRQKLYRLGLKVGVNLKKQTPQIMMVFPKEYIERRKVIIKHALPRLKKLLGKIDKLDDLSPDTVNTLSKVVRAMASLFNAIEKWETGEEMLQIWAHEVEEEGEEVDADSAGKG